MSDLPINSLLDGDLLLVLSVASANRGLYGLEILQAVNVQREGLFRKLSFGTLYPALDRLERKGLIEWQWGADDEKTGGGRRKYYRLTNLGIQVLNQWQAYLLSLQTAPILI